MGDQLAAVLWAQEAEAEAVAYPSLEVHGSALVELSRRLGDPVVWPLGPAGERIAGAASLISKGHLRVRNWNHQVRDERVLLFAVVSLTPLPLFAAARLAADSGAGWIAACGIRVEGLEETGLGPLSIYYPVTEAVLTGAGTV